MTAVAQEATRAETASTLRSRRQSLWTAVTGTAAATAGWMQGLAFGAEAGAALQFTAMVGFAALVLWLQSQRAWRPLLLATAVFWYVTYGVGLRWFVTPLLNPQLLGAALGCTLYALLLLLLCFIPVLAVAVVAIAGASIRSMVVTGMLLSSAISAGEWLREWLLPGFPWLTAAYAHVDSPFAVLLPFAGAGATSWLVNFSACSGAALILSMAVRPRERALLACAAAIVLGIAVAAVTVPRLTEESGVLKVAVLQTAVSGKDKFRASLLGAHIRELGEFATAHEADLIIAPETAVPTPWPALTPVQQQFLAHAVTPSRALLFGIFAGDASNVIFNSATILQRSGPGAALQRTVYIKQHLAPFGEYAPRGFGWITNLLDMPMSNLQATRDSPQNFQVRGVTIIPSVCEDLLYGDDLRTTAAAPRMLVNLSNLEFFPGQLVRRQYLQIARVRALEQQVPVLMAGNQGPTVYINAAGKVERQLSNTTAGSLEFSVRPHRGVTPYARFGNVFWYVVLVISAMLGFAGHSLKSLKRRVARSSA